jgi:hypothetical protein
VIYLKRRTSLMADARACLAGGTLCLSCLRQQQILVDHHPTTTQNVEAVDLISP